MVVGDISSSSSSSSHGSLRHRRHQADRPGESQIRPPSPVTRRPGPKRGKARPTGMQSLIDCHTTVNLPSLPIAAGTRLVIGCLDALPTTSHAHFCPTTVCRQLVLSLVPRLFYHSLRVSVAGRTELRPSAIHRAKPYCVEDFNNTVVT
ncbi:hypothetical protein ElyMa_004342400 [Elysia marginata]|uniref:Uncharacterized protein n=1 Tax=Elysia marginata TaxID=1093978 RepID=A0AAV4H2U1_9GAST|nr:hypothetical protein ElyMa_004342400 [Elysia marginata]